MNRMKLWWKTQVLRQDIRSEWMKGLLWAEDYCNKFDLDFIRNYLEEVGHVEYEFTQGIWDYLKHYEERLK